MRARRRIGVALLGCLALMVATLSPATAATSGPSRIVGGKPTGIESVPYQVWVIQWTPDHLGYFSCGGSLINTEWVITAAHCVTTESATVATAANMRVYSGTSDVSFRYLGGAGPYQSLVSQVIRHPSYSFDDFRGPVNDVALLHLSNPLTFDATRNAIALPFDVNPSTWPAKGTAVTVSGWGLMSTSAPDIPDHLQSAIISVLSGPSDSRCGSWSSYDRTQNLCAGGTKNGRDICQGDSGGPYAITVNGVATLAGVTSFNSGICGAVKYPAQSVRVTSFLNWFVPAPPTSLSWSWSGSTATITWTPSTSTPASPLTGYRIEVSTDGGATWALEGTVSAGASSYIANCSVAATCLYRVAGTNPVTSSGSPLRFATVPTAPQSVRVTSSSPRSISVSWTAPLRTFESPLRDYSVWWSTSATGPFEQVGSTTTSTRSTFTRPAIGPLYVTVRARTTLAFPANFFGPTATPAYAR